MQTNKLEALKDYLIKADLYTQEELKEIGIEEEQDSRFTIGNCEEYLVLTDDEADTEVRLLIQESVWAFKPSFLSAHSEVDEEVFEALADKCEGANGAVLRLIKDFDHFVDDAVRHDGRGHFMHTYDGQEHEHNDLFIYRTN